MRKKQRDGLSGRSQETERRHGKETRRTESRRDDYRSNRRGVRQDDYRNARRDDRRYDRRVQREDPRKRRVATVESVSNGWYHSTRRESVGSYDSDDDFADHKYRYGELSGLEFDSGSDYIDAGEIQSRGNAVETIEVSDGRRLEKHIPRRVDRRDRREEAEHQSQYQRRRAPTTRPRYSTRRDDSRECSRYGPCAACGNKGHSAHFCHKRCSFCKQVHGIGRCGLFQRFEKLTQFVRTSVDKSTVPTDLQGIYGPSVNPALEDDPVSAESRCPMSEHNPVVEKSVHQVRTESASPMSTCDPVSTEFKRSMPDHDTVIAELGNLASAESYSVVTAESISPSSQRYPAGNEA